MDEDHCDLQEGEVVGAFSVLAGVDAGETVQPGVGPFDRPALPGLGVGGFQPAFLAPPDFPDGGAFGDRLAGPAGLADPRLDPSLPERFCQYSRGVAAVGPQLAGPDPLAEQLVDQR